MYRTQVDNGALNNYPVEPKVVCATYPTSHEQRRYIIQGALGALMVTTTIMISLMVS